MKFCGQEKPRSRKKTSYGTELLRCVGPEGHEDKRHRYVWHVIGYEPKKGLDESV